MKALVNSIIPDSIADELEIKPGDEVISIDEIKPADLIDYKYLIASEEIALHIKRTDGEEEIIDIEKDIEEDLGIVFESAVFDKVKACNNKCVFCFIDQQPDGLRDSLYVKDDDYRLSYLQGTYVTLTNLNDRDRERIEALRLGPLYVSVHTTNPDLREKMLKNPKSRNILDELKWLDSIDIPVHAQIVVCPGLNDGEELKNTLNDLSLFKNIDSVALVPVGVTKYRKDYPLNPPNKAQARNIISLAKKYKNVYPSDELYIKAGYELPETKHYGNFSQLDDGVGTGRLLLDDFNQIKHLLPEALSKPLSITLGGGELAYHIMQPIAEELNKIKNLSVELIAIESNFWGEKVTVSGLITGQDILDALMPIKDRIENLVLPSVMLRQYTEQFLDNITLTEIKQKLDINVKIIENYYSTEELIEFICLKK